MSTAEKIEEPVVKSKGKEKEDEKTELVSGVAGEAQPGDSNKTTRPSSPICPVILWSMFCARGLHFVFSLSHFHLVGRR